MPEERALPEGMSFKDVSPTPTANEPPAGKDAPGGPCKLQKVHSKSLEKEKVMQSNDLRNQGHDGEALCIASSTGMAYIVSGGEDGTVRVWKFAAEPYTCYRLVAVFHHNNPVTSVALTECSQKQKPLVISSDKVEGLQLWDMERDIATLHKMEGITDVSCKQEAIRHHEVGTDGNWLLAVAYNKSAKMLEAKRPEAFEFGHAKIAGKYELEEVFTVEHATEVLKVQHVPGGLAEGAAMATCAKRDETRGVEGCVALWNIKGQKIAELWNIVPKDSLAQERRVVPIDCFNLVPNLTHERDVGAARSRGWLLTGGETEVCIWAMHEGQVQESNADWAPSKEFNPPPVERYDIPGGVRDVAMDPTDNEFMLISRQDNISSMIEVATGGPSKIGMENAVGPNGPASRLVKRGHGKCIFEVQHVGRVREIAVHEDQDKEPQLVSALTDGRLISWDLEGPDAGQRVAELRNLTLLEIVLPAVLVSIIFCQVYSHAFGPAVTWEEEVKRPANLAFRISIVDFSMPVNISRTKIFWARSILVAVEMLWFIVAALVGLPDRIAKIQRKIRLSNRYQEEVADERHFGCAQICFTIVGATKKLVELTVMACTSFLAIPTYTTAFQIVDCVEREDGNTVATAPDLKCYTGGHLALVVIIAVLVPLYSFLLLPHAVVHGDTDYVQYDRLWQPRLWKSNAERYATLLYTGYAHPYKQHCFGHCIADLAVKIILPGVSLLTTSRPLFQVVTLFIVGTAHFLISVIWPPFVNAYFSTLQQGMRLMVACAMLCGIVTVVDGGKHKGKASLLLIASICIVAPATLAKMAWRIRRKAVSPQDNSQLITHIQTDFHSVRQKRISSAVSSDSVDVPTAWSTADSTQVHDIGSEGP